MFSKKQLSTFISFALLVVLVIIFGGWIAHKADYPKPDYYFNVSKNINVFGKVYEEITNRYVEVIDPEQFMRAGIYGMLKTLDPYTVFIEKDDNAELQIMTHGKYGGVGMRISKRDGWATVVEPPFDGTPSAKVGIREGDRILEVDSMSTKDLSISETANRLRGDPGTEVFIKVKRVGEGELEFRLIRAEIKVEEISYAGIIKDNIGYIRLGHFSRNVGNQMYKAIADLKKQGMESLILDLRGNPGGLLESAVAVADNFFEKGQVIVSTKGKLSGTDQDYSAKIEPIWGTEPLVVLVDTISASASEIVAGAIQDMDRGVIVGSPTFGKGLVQTVIPINKETALKITTAKYYIPSGRLIQKPGIYKNTKVLLNHPANKKSDTAKELKLTSTSSAFEYDSSKVYKTASGRIVHGNGGIVPDIRVKRIRLPTIIVQMIMKSMFFNFSLEYAAEHANIKRGFDVDQKIIDDYKKFLEGKKFEYKTVDEQELEKLEDTIKEREYQKEAKSAFNELKRIIQERKTKDFDESIDFVKSYLKGEISAKLWGTAARVEAGFNVSPQIQKALEVLSDKDRYYAILKGDKSLN